MVSQWFAFDYRHNMQVFALPLIVLSSLSIRGKQISRPIKEYQSVLFEAAKEAGADIVGMDDLAEQVKKGEMNFDVVVASPDAMRVVGQLGQILGPRGLMPNPKTGTVTPDVATAVKNAKAGQVRYRNDKNGIIHASIGKIAFEANQIQENLEALLEALKKATCQCEKTNET